MKSEADFYAKNNYTKCKLVLVNSHFMKTKYLDCNGNISKTFSEPNIQRLPALSPSGSGVGQIFFRAEHKASPPRSAQNDERTMARARARGRANVKRGVLRASVGADAHPL